MNTSLQDQLRDKDEAISANPELAFQEIWAAVKKEKLIGGQPRSESSVRALDFGQLALSIAGATAEPRWEAEASSIMAYVLNANESYADSLPYYERAIQMLEASGREAQAARIRLGYVYAMLMSGRAQDAIQIARVADEWFLRNGDEVEDRKFKRRRSSQPITTFRINDWIVGGLRSIVAW